jgi:beta-ureidopropionase
MADRRGTDAQIGGEFPDGGQPVAGGELAGPDEAGDGGGDAVRGRLLDGLRDGLQIRLPLSIIDLHPDRPYVYAKVISRNIREMFTAHNNKKTLLTEDFMTVVRAALTQTTWTGDKESMIAKHEKMARDAAAQGAQIICFQELFYGPYFGIIEDSKYYDYAESIPGPTVDRFVALAKELKMVIVLPIYEEEMPGVYYNTAVVIDADGTMLGKYRKHHIPNLPQFWEKFYFRPGNLGYPVFDTAVGKVGVYICYDRHFPEGWRELGLNGAQIVFNPSATKPGLSNRLWELEQPAAAAANQYFIGANNRIGTETEEFGDDAVTFYGSSYFVDPRGNFVGDIASTDTTEIVIRDLDLDTLREVRNSWQFYRDRRPESYTSILKL